MTKYVATAGQSVDRQWFGVYPGVVAQRNANGTIKAKVPQVLGTEVTNWAAPLIPVEGGAPAVGSRVSVVFLGGDINSPGYMSAVVVSTDVAPVDWINAVESYGADPTGTRSSSTSINNALTAANAGQTVYLPNGTYLISSPLSIPEGVELMGSLGPKHTSDLGTTIKCGAGFSGTGAITFPSGSMEQRLTRLDIDGSAPPSGTTLGIDGNTNAIPYVQLNDLHIHGIGFTNGIETTASSNGWRSRNVVVGSTSATGFNLNSPDNHWLVCQAISCGTHGWNVNGGQNSKFVDCRADFNGDYGLIIQGTWTNTTGSGGVQFVGFSTDRNVQYGVLITATANGPALFSNLATRRDGSGGSGAGVRVSNSTMPVIISGWQCYPGVNDDGSGTAGPASGLSWNGTNTYVAVADALIHAVTTPWPGTETNLHNRNVATRTSYTSPTSISLVTDA